MRQPYYPPSEQAQTRINLVNAQKKFATAQRAKRAHEMRLAGETLSSIGRALGVSATRADQLIRKYRRDN